MPGHPAIAKRLHGLHHPARPHEYEMARSFSNAGGKGITLGMKEFYGQCSAHVFLILHNRLLVPSYYYYFFLTIVRIVAIITDSPVSSYTSTYHFTIPFGISFSSFSSWLVFSLQVNRTPMLFRHRQVSETGIHQFRNLTVPDPLLHHQQIIPQRRSE